MTKTFEKPIVTISGKKILFKTDLHQRIIQDLPQEDVEWRRRLDSKTKSVYVDVDFVDFDVDNVERSSERLSRMSLANNEQEIDRVPLAEDQNSFVTEGSVNKHEQNESQDFDPTTDTPTLAHKEAEIVHATNTSTQESINEQYQNDATRAFFNPKLLGRPILHTYWADKTDFESENKKTQFDEWIGQVQASTCTEWAIIIIEDGDLKTQFGSALFKSKLQSSTSQANASSSSLTSLTQSSTASFLDRMKKGLSTMFQIDSNSDRWLTLINQNRPQDNKAQESYNNFLRKFRNLIMASFSKQIELFEEQLRVQRDMRSDKNWSFLSHFSMQEELAFAFEFLTLFDEALLQYDLLDALFTDYLSSSSFNSDDDQLYETWTSFKSWPTLCLDMHCEHSKELRRRVVAKEASLLDLRNYLFAKQCDLMLMQNEPWRVAASTTVFLQNCIREHERLNIDVVPGALTCWSFTSALEVLQKCECYSCTSTMENYSLHTIDIWNCARRKLVELGELTHRTPGSEFSDDDAKHIDYLVAGLGPDPHNGVSYQANEISPQARLVDALASQEQYFKHLVEISELTLGTYKHIGRKRHALLVGKELADLYIAQGNNLRAMPFLLDLERAFMNETWSILLADIRRIMTSCNMDKIEEVGKT